MKPLKSQNLYEILGVSRYATQEEIRNAYEISRHTFKENSLATYSLFSDEENMEILTSVTSAYQTLYNPEQRRRYDDQLVAEKKQAAIGGGSGSVEHSAGQRLQMAAAAKSSHTPGAGSPPILSVAGSRAEVDAAPAVGVELKEQVQLGANSESAEFDLQAAADAIESVEQFDGETLRQIRISAGMEVSDLAELTKIRSTYIQYLEEENFEFLPAPVYIKGFVTIIAKTLSLPPDRVAKEYMSRIPGYSHG